MGKYQLLNVKSLNPSIHFLLLIRIASIGHICVHIKEILLKEILFNSAKREKKKKNKLILGHIVPNGLQYFGWS